MRRENFDNECGKFSKSTNVVCRDIPGNFHSQGGGNKFFVLLREDLRARDSSQLQRVQPRDMLKGINWM